MNSNGGGGVSMAVIVPYTLGFIGAGKMAESIVNGVLGSGILPPSYIRTAHRRPHRRKLFESIGVRVLDSNEAVVEDSDVIIFSVKPHVIKEVLLKLGDHLSENQVLVSVAAGIKLKDLQKWSGGHRRFIRAMPNTPASIHMAATVISMGEGATKEDELTISTLFGAIGKTWITEEKFFDAITGLSGSGPAYIYMAIEALSDGGVAAGLPRDLALHLASQTVLGAAAMVNSSGKHPAELKDEVTSAGGTTIAGIHELEKGGFRGILMNAVTAAAKRSAQISTASSST